jgi:hypothetical protein
MGSVARTLGCQNATMGDCPPYGLWLENHGGNPMDVGASWAAQILAKVKHFLLVRRGTGLEKMVTTADADL